MFFISFIVLLVIFADSIWCFIIPFLSIFLRAAYKETNVNLIKLITVFFAIFLFLLNLALSNKTMNENVIGSVRLVVFSALLIHIFDNLNRRSLKSSKGFNLYFYMGMRIMSIITERLSDMWLIFTIRWKQTKIIKRPKLLFSTFGNFLLESLVVNNQINLVNYEKGGLITEQPANYDGQKAIIIPITSTKRITIPYSVIGDLGLLFLIIFPQIIIDTHTLPKKMMELMQFKLQ